MQQLTNHGVESDVDLPHSHRIAAMIGMELRGELAAGRADLVERGVGADAEHRIRIARRLIRRHAVEGYVVDRSSA